MARTKIPRKNYFIIFGVVVLIFCACLAATNIYRVIQDNRTHKSPLAIHQVLYEDLKNTTIEMNNDAFLVISYTGDDEVYNNEKEIKKMLNKQNMLDDVTYLDVTKDHLNADFITDLNEVLNLSNNLKIKTFPAVIYYRNGVATYMVDSSNHMMNVSDFEKIIDMYELAS